MHHAVELFSHYGYSKTNIGDIAKACNMSAGNLYRYFKNKQGIGEAVVQDYMNTVEASINVEMADSALGWEDRLRQLIILSVESLICQYRQTPRMVELSDMICEGNSGILARHIEWKRAVISAQLNEGVRLGELSISAENTDIAAGILLDSVRAFLLPNNLKQTDLDTVPERVTGILDYMIAGMKHAR